MDRGEFVSPGLIYNSTIYPLVRELLGGGDVQLLYAGVMWAEGHSNQTPQKWHGDGGHCFTENGHQPPHCINVFYPLIDLSSARARPDRVHAGDPYSRQIRRYRGHIREPVL